MPSESKDPPWNPKIEVGQLEDAIAPARDLHSLLVSHKRNCSSERACGQSKVTKNSAAEQRKIVNADWNCTSSPKALSPPLPTAHLCMSQHPLFRPFPRTALQAFLGSSSGPLTWSGFPCPTVKFRNNGQSAGRPGRAGQGGLKAGRAPAGQL